jgi:hypothetical protein
MTPHRSEDTAPGSGAGLGVPVVVDRQRRPSGDRRAGIARLGAHPPYPASRRGSVLANVADQLERSQRARSRRVARRSVRGTSTRTRLPAHPYMRFASSPLSWSPRDGMTAITLGPLRRAHESPHRQQGHRQQDDRKHIAGAERERRAIGPRNTHRSEADRHRNTSESESSEEGRSPHARQPAGTNDGFGHAVGEAPGESDTPEKSALAQGTDPVHRPLADDAGRQTRRAEVCMRPNATPPAATRAAAPTNPPNAGPWMIPRPAMTAV